ncbi:MAG TPA: response regulator [Verrucomicrobiae bacterium]|jgi:CheY-like chemotaxis protein
MGKPNSILIVDDDADWLQVCSELLSQLPSKPQIHTAGTGTRAIAKLDDEPCRLLICDLKMPKVDGLQVLAIVRKRFPDLRTVVLSGLEGEEYRSRAYALGVDMFWLKSEMQQNINMFLDCIESLLGRDSVGSGFRGIQSKSLMDIIQLECMSRNSLMLQISRGPLIGRIWIQDGDLIDAEVENARGEAAFQRILAWKSGSFEHRPAEPGRERTINKSVNALLLESAQALDEMANPQTEFIQRDSHRKTITRLSLIAAEGAEFVVTAPVDANKKVETMGTASAEPMAAWARRAMENSRRLGERLGAGPLSHLVGSGLQLRLLVLPQDDQSVLVGWPADTAEAQLLERTKKLVASWDS